MQSQLTINLGTLTLTSSAVDTSTQAIGSFDISDAYAIGFVVAGNTTAPGLQVQVCPTSDTGGTFSPMLFPSSAAGLVYLSSAGLNTLFAPAAKQVRVGSSNVTSTSYSVTVTKQVYV